MTSNPYSAPTAAVADPTVAVQGKYVEGGRGVSAGRGWDWITEGWGLFRKQPGVWIGIFVIFALIYIVASLIPFIGGIATAIFAPVFSAGFMLGCRALDQEEELRVGHLFAGFREKFGTLVGVGALYFVLTFVIALVAIFVVGGSVMGLARGSPGQDPLTVVLFVLVFLALLLPVVMAYWFAAPLVVFHDKGAVTAMTESFKGCLKNIVPFLIYGLVMLVLAIVATIPLALGWLVLGPVLAASIYTAYKDVFTEA